VDWAAMHDDQQRLWKIGRGSGRSPILSGHLMLLDVKGIIGVEFWGNIGESYSTRVTSRAKTSVQ
jgi:hypothetical protein